MASIVFTKQLQGQLCDREWLRYPIRYKRNGIDVPCFVRELESVFSVAKGGGMYPRNEFELHSNDVLMPLCR